MSISSDLVRDTKLKTEILNDDFCVHTLYESDPRSQRRAVPRLEYWQRQKIIGRGTYGSVRLERCVKGERDVHVRAVKQLSTARFPHQKPLDYARELEAIAKFSQPKYERCFVKAFGWYEDAESLFIAMEYLENGDLHHYLQKSPPFSADVAGETTFQILEGLLFMHENHFAHRDLKPANILLRSKPPDIWIKIGDFGLSKRVEDELGLTNTLKGTMGFIAPELHGFTSRETDYAPDIWALGEIAFQMLTKKPTFRNLGLLARYVHDAKLFPEDDLHEQQVHDQVIDFVRSTMCALPADRFTAQQGLEHPWILSFAPESPTPELPETERRVSLESVVEDLGAWTAFSAAISEHSLQAIKAVAARSTPKTPASSSSSFQQGTVVPRKKVPEMPRMLSSPSAPSTSRSADYFSIHDARAKIDRILVPQDVNLGIFDRAHLETPGTVTTAATSPSPLVSTDAFDKGRILQSLDPALRAKLLSMGMSDDQLADNADFIHTYLLAQEKEQSNGTQDSIPSSSLLPSLGQRTREVQGVAKRQKAKPPALTGMSGVPSKHSQLPTRDQHPVPFQDHATPAASGRQVIYKPAGSRPILQYHVDERVKGKHRGKNTEPPSRYRQEDAATRTVEVHGLANFTTEQDVRTFCRSAGKITNVKAVPDWGLQPRFGERTVFVTFSNNSSAKTATHLNLDQFRPARVTVTLATSSVLQPESSSSGPASANRRQHQSVDYTNNPIQKTNNSNATDKYYKDKSLKGFNEAVQPAKRDLRSWWRDFTKPSSGLSNAERVTRRRDTEPSRTKPSSEPSYAERVSRRRDAEPSRQPVPGIMADDGPPNTKGPSQIFGIALATSIQHSSTAISLKDDDGNHHIYGYVPTIIAECGTFLKDKGYDTKGNINNIWPVSSKRKLQELQEVFDYPPTYGMGFDWASAPYATGFDAAQLIVRYLESLPEPLVPEEYYPRFCTVMTEQSTIEGQIELLQRLLIELPSLNRHLLIYLLDILAVIVANSDVNHVSTAALAEQFRSGILRHSQSKKRAHTGSEFKVFEFLIDHQYSFAIGFESNQEFVQKMNPWLQDESSQSDT